MCGYLKFDPRWGRGQGRQLRSAHWTMCGYLKFDSRWGRGLGRHFAPHIVSCAVTWSSTPVGVDGSLLFWILANPLFFNELCAWSLIHADKWIKYWKRNITVSSAHWGGDTTVHPSHCWVVFGDGTSISVRDGKPISCRWAKRNGMYWESNTLFISLKSATKSFIVLFTCTRSLITELLDKLRLKYPLLPTIPPYPTMRLETIRSIIPISCSRHPKSVWNTSA